MVFGLSLNTEYM